MYYRTFLFFCVFIISGTVIAQENLIVNGDFEEYTECPIPVDQIQYVTGVSSPNQGTPDYFNSDCGTSGSPVNYVIAQSGKGFMGLAIAVKGGAFREYLQIKLNETLNEGFIYRLNFYTRISKYSESSINSFQVSIENLITYDSSATESQINLLSGNSSFLSCFSDSVWTKIEIYFTANGGENYLIFGNGNDWEKISFCDYFGSGGTAYYFVDNFSLQFEGLEFNFPNSFSPNNDLINDSWKIFESVPKELSFSLSIFDRWGNKVSELKDNNTIWDGTFFNNGKNFLTSGTYFYTFDYSYKSLKNSKKGTVTLLH